MQEPPRQTIRALLIVGEVTAGPPLSPLLGQYQINVNEFITRFNEKAKIFEKGTPVDMRLTRNPTTKTYDFSLVCTPLRILFDNIRYIDKKTGKIYHSPNKFYDIMVYRAL